MDTIGTRNLPFIKRCLQFRGYYFETYSNVLYIKDVLHCVLLEGFTRITTLTVSIIIIN